MSIANNRALATIENESEFQTRLMQYFSILIQSAPVHNALLNTKTYHPQNPSNPQFLDMVKAF
jgi:hypothetical protein